MHILIVDNDDFSRILLEVIIEGTIHIFQTASNGLEAIQATQEEQFDLVFMDLDMPIMGGIEAIKHIRQNTSLKNQPTIIVITANDMALLEINCHAIGINGFILKPVSIEVIENVLR